MLVVLLLLLLLLVVVVVVVVVVTIQCPSMRPQLRPRPLLTRASTQWAMIVLCADGWINRRKQ